MSNAMESIKENIEPIRAPNGLYNLGGDDIMAAAAEVLDDISSLTVSAEGSSLSGIREVQTTLPIRKPEKDEFFRTHATAFRGPYSIYELKAQMNTETYFVTPKILGMFKDDLLKGPGKVVVLRLSMARAGRRSCIRSRRPIHCRAPTDTTKAPANACRPQLTTGSACRRT